MTCIIVTFQPFRQVKINLSQQQVGGLKRSLDNGDHKNGNSELGKEVEGKLVDKKSNDDELQSDGTSKKLKQENEIVELKV